MGFVRCSLYLIAVAAVMFGAGLHLPDFLLNAKFFIYVPYKWEKNGKIYEKIGINKWKDRVPDMSRLLPKKLLSKKLAESEADKLPLLVRETCRAEFVHKSEILLGLVCLVLWRGLGGVIMTAFWTAANMPFVIIQRYNRPRLVRLIDKLNKRNAAALVPDDEEEERETVKTN